MHVHQSTPAISGRSSMEARLISDRAQWNRFVASMPTGHLCQTYEWSEHGEDIAARDGALHVGVVEGEQLVAAVLLVKSHMPGISQSLFYAPRGPVVADPDSPALQVLIKGAAQLARKAGGFALRIEPNMPDADKRWEQALLRLGFHPTNHAIYLRNTWILDVRPSEEQLLADMKITWRYNIGYAQRKGVIVRPAANEAEFDRFYKLEGDTARREDFYLYPKQVFRDMLDHYSPEAAARDATAEMVLLVAEYQGEIIGATTMAMFGDWAWSMHTGLSDEPNHRKVKPNYLMQWSCIQLAKQHGCSFYDFRVIPDILEPGQPMYGVYEFKRGFGGFFYRAVPTMDYVLNPLVYYPYQFATEMRRTLRERRRVKGPTSQKPADSTASEHEQQDA
jgi:peptidoglycan pentaglycine glycine transferase (the first glycine)